MVITNGIGTAVGSSSIAKPPVLTVYPAKLKKKVYHSFGIAERKPGCRRPVIEKKLTELSTRAVMQPVSTSFFLLSAEDAIEVLGNYNPLYAGRPKAVAMKLLNASAGQLRDAYYDSLCKTGLFYQTPVLVGVRAARMLTSYAGLMLIDHWSERFPAFKPFADAYVTKKMRRRISEDCFDMVNGKTPKWIEDEIKKNEERTVKWQAREYRRIKKEAELAAYKPAPAPVTSPWQVAPGWADDDNNNLFYHRKF